MFFHSASYTNTCWYVVFSKGEIFGAACTLYPVCSLQSQFWSQQIINRFLWNLKFSSAHNFFNVYFMKNLQISTFIASLIKSQGVRFSAFALQHLLKVNYLPCKTEAYLKFLSLPFYIVLVFSKKGKSF